jgi:hypothetical protein
VGVLFSKKTDPRAVATVIQARMTWFKLSEMLRRLTLLQPRLKAKKAAIPISPNHCLEMVGACCSLYACENSKGQQCVMGLLVQNVQQLQIPHLCCHQWS